MHFRVGPDGKTVHHDTGADGSTSKEDSVCAPDKKFCIEWSEFAGVPQPEDTRLQELTTSTLESSAAQNSAVVKQVLANSFAL